jgi:MerR family transcriptional regulator, mercuric resistance operon regulatory protein
MDTYLGTFYNFRPRTRGAHPKRRSGVQEGMTIGRLAKAAGVNVETVRYYQRRGLLPEPAKPPGGQRRYPAAVLERLGFIRQAQQLGFSLEEVRELLDLCARQAQAGILTLAERKRETLEVRAAELKRMLERVARLIEAARRTGPDGAAAILDALRADQ